MSKVTWKKIRRANKISKKRGSFFVNLWAGMAHSSKPKNNKNYDGFKMIKVR